MNMNRWIKTIDLLTDIDGNVYQTVIIGNQVWMAENLKVTRYRNGDVIPTGHTNSEWTVLSTGAQCVYNNNASNELDIYGRIYNWYAAADSRGLAPDGWRIPTDDDIKQLEKFLGVTQEEADATQLRGTNQGCQLASRADLWTNGVLKNDSHFGNSGFSLLSAGSRSGYYGYFYDMTYYGCFWSSTESNNYCAWYRELGFDDTQVYRNGTSKINGFSVRCVRDV